MKRKIWMVSLALVTVGCLGIGIAARACYVNCGLSGVNSVDGLLGLDIRLSGLLGYSPHGDAEEIEELSYISFRDEQDIYVEEAESVPVIVRVRPTEHLQIRGTSLEQGFVVLEVIRGDGHIAEGQEGMVSSLGIWGIEGDKIELESHSNLMYDEWEYLLFLSPSPLNAYQDTPEYFWGGSSLFSCIRLLAEEAGAVSNATGRLSEYKDYAFFAYSDRIAEEVNEIRTQLVMYAETL